MRQVKEVRRSRLLVAYNVVPALYLTAERGREMFETLLGEFPELIGLPPVIMENQGATFLRTARPNRPPEALCQLLSDSVQVTLQDPSPVDVETLPRFLQKVYELVRNVYGVQRVSRAGRVDNRGYVLAEGAEDARKTVRECLTKLTVDQATDVQLQFTKRDGPYNVNFSVVPDASRGSKADADPPVHNVVLTGSDVNNWDVSGDVPWDKVQEILARGAKHADEEVPQFLRENLGIDTQS